MMIKNNMPLQKRMIRYADAPAFFSISPSTLRRYAIKAQAIVKLNQTALVDLQIFSEYLSVVNQNQKSSSNSKKNEQSFERRLLTIRDTAFAYSISESKARREATLAGALVKIGRCSLINIECFEEHLNLCRITDETFYRC